MAIHSFAKLDDNNLVLTVLAVADADCNNGDEATGIAFLTNLTGWSKWKIVAEGEPASIGGIYNEEIGGFQPKKPVDGAVWSTEHKIWRYPEDIEAGKLPE